MPEYATFDRFARDLLFFCNKFRNYESWNDFLEPVPLMRDASFLKDYFADYHSEQFDLIFNKTEYLDLQTEEQFFRYSIPRCLNLIDKERYFDSLMLIAAFLHEFLFWLKYLRVCHRFHFTAYKCLLAVFKRALEDSFEVHGGFKGLEKYVKGISKELYSVPYYKFNIDYLYQGDNHLREKVFKLIEKCDDFSDESFHLNDYELSLIRDDDIKSTIEILDSNVLSEDPINLKWPPSKEEMQEVVKQYYIDLANWKPDDNYNIVTRLFDGCCDTDSESDSVESYTSNDIKFSDLDIYINEIQEKARKRYGYKICREKMELRKCPCCGTKCYQFSCNQYLKQLDLALFQRIPKWKHYLRKFISYTRSKIGRFFNPYIVYKSKEAPAIESTANS